MGNCLKYILGLAHSFSAVHRISGKKLREIKHLAEGGYGYVSLVQDVETRKAYAMKKMICQTPEQKAMFEREVKIMKDLCHCKHVIGFFGSHEIQRDGFVETYIVMEQGEKTVYDLLLQTEKKGSIALSEKQILKIIKQAALGLQEMHAVGIYHHDVKVQNILLCKDGSAKLCDFGSATRERVDLSNLPKSKIYHYEQHFEKNTTLMYRPPEMIDVYLKYPVDERVDVWMLGCVLFVLNFKYHPFQEQGKLSIVNAVIKYPPTASPKMEKLMRHLLTPNPFFRPTLEQLVRIVEEWESGDFQLNEVAARIRDNEEYLRRGEYGRVGTVEWHKMRPGDEWGEYES